MIHAGKSVRTICTRGNQRFAGTSVHGDIDIIPAGMSSHWEVSDSFTALVLGIPQDLLRASGGQYGVHPDRLEILNRFHVRDPRMEHVGWALKAECEAGYPNGRLFTDSLGMGLAVSLLADHSSESQHSSASRGSAKSSGGLSGSRLRRLFGYIEENLDRDLSLNVVAGVAGLSVSHCKTAFRNSVGMPIHQYVILRRIERARALLRERRLSVGQVALATGFAHQSHLAYHMRRVLGVSPKSLAQA